MGRNVVITVFHLALISMAAAQTNNWINPNTGNWHDLSWSLGIRPAPAHTVTITNASSKAVIINSTTRDAFPGSMTVSNLLVSAPANATNTLLLNFTGPAVPFRVLNQLNLATNGFLVSLSSVLEMATNATLYLDGGTVNQDGGSNYLGQGFIGWDHFGSYNLTSGIAVASSMTVGREGGGRFKHWNGTNTVEQALVINGSSASYDLHNGEVRATTLAVAKGPASWSYGEFQQIAGRVLVADELAIGSTFSQLGRYTLTGGELTSDRTTIGYEGEAAFHQSGGSFRTRLMTLGGMYSRAAIYTLEGGGLSAGGMLFTENSEMRQSGGSNSVSETLSLSGGFYSLFSGALWSSNTSVSARRGVASAFLQTNGVHVVSNELAIIGESLSGFSRYYLAGGTLDCSVLRIERNCALEHTGGQLTNRTRTTLNRGSMELDNVTQSLGSLIVNGRSFIHLGTNMCIQRFARSAHESWSEDAELIILGWQGSESGGGLHRIYFGHSAEGLNNHQLARIRIGNWFAKLLPTGEIVPTVQPIISAQYAGAQLTLTWPTDQLSLTLQTATNVFGPYIDVPNANSPHVVPISPGSPLQFFRLISSY